MIQKLRRWWKERHVVDASKQPSHIAEADEARLEVQSLGDRAATSLPSGSGVTERIQQNRKERHHKTVEDMEQELAMISAELEPRIRTASELVKTQLAENDKGGGFGGKKESGQLRFGGRDRPFKKPIVLGNQRLGSSGGGRRGDWDHNRRRREQQSREFGRDSESTTFRSKGYSSSRS